MDKDTKALLVRMVAVLTDIVYELQMHDPATDVFQVEYLNKRLREINLLVMKVTE